MSLNEAPKPMHQHNIHQDKNNNNQNELNRQRPLKNSRNFNNTKEKLSGNTVKKEQQAKQENCETAYYDTTEYYDTEGEDTSSYELHVVESLKRAQNALQAAANMPKQIGVGVVKRVKIISFDNYSSVWVRLNHDKKTINLLTEALDDWCSTKTKANTFASPEEENEIKIGNYLNFFLYFESILWYKSTFDLSK